MKNIKLSALAALTILCISGSGYAANPSENTTDTFTAGTSQAAVCFKGNKQDPLFYPYSKSVAIVKAEGFFSSKEYTAWRLGAVQQGKYVYLLTAWLDKKDGDSVKVTFDDPAKDGSCEQPRATRSVTVSGKALKGDRQLGYQLVRIDLSEIIPTIPPIGQDDEINVIKKLPYLGIDTRSSNQLNEANKTEFYLFHQKNVVGMPPIKGITRYITTNCQGMEFSGGIGFDFNCTVTPTDLSKGAPLIDRITHRVIAIATTVDVNEKRAIPVAEIWPEISHYFEGRLPDTALIYHDDKSDFLMSYNLHHAVNTEAKRGTLSALPPQEQAGNNLRDNVICRWQLPEGAKLIKDGRTMAIYQIIDEIDSASSEATAYCRLEGVDKANQYLPVRLMEDINDGK